MNHVNIKEYIEKNRFPLIVEAIFIVLALLKIIPMTYLNFIFYLTLILYFASRKEYSWGQWKQRLKGEDFWKNFFITAGIIGIGFLIMTLIQNAFPALPLGEFGLRRDTLFTLLLFAIQTIVFPPLAEEIFYRKYLIVLEDKRSAVITLFISSFLFAAEHAIYPFGLLTYMILGLAFGCAYLIHKDIYVMMAAHFVINFVGNGGTVIVTILNRATF